MCVYYRTRRVGYRQDGCGCRAVHFVYTGYSRRGARSSYVWTTATVSKCYISHWLRGFAGQRRVGRERERERERLRHRSGPVDTLVCANCHATPSASSWWSPFRHIHLKLQAELYGCYRSPAIQTFGYKTHFACSLSWTDGRLSKRRNRIEQ